jgi:RNA polymerase subunit RPABC4/transcription elongation factor Spt4
MSKIVKCKSCKKEVAKGAKLCPHCGQKNPTVNMGKTFIGFVAIVAIISYFMSGDIQDKTIYKADYGDRWAFTTDEAKLACFVDEVGISPVIILDGKRFGLTGYADNKYGQGDLNAINKYLLKDKSIRSGVYKDLGIFTREAKALCENDD